MEDLLRGFAPWAGAAMAATLLVAGTANSASAIVNGSEVSAEAFSRNLSPVVSVRTQATRCTGTYIGDQWVVTAAHCLTDGTSPAETSVDVRAGSVHKNSGGVHLASDRVHVHPGYRYGQAMPNDIALVHLTSSAGLIEAGVRPARVVSADWGYAPGLPASTAGWGMTENDEYSVALRSVPLKLWSHHDCVHAHALGKVTASMVCAGPLDPGHVQGTGMGDSGGPLLVNIDNEINLVGVTSWASSAQRVRLANEPPVFTRVGAFAEWIDDIRQGVNLRPRIHTIAGDGVSDSSGDGGPATTAQLNTPTGVAVDIYGNRYFTDTVNHRVRRINPEGVITTIAGTGEKGFSGDGGPAITAQLNTPTGVAVDASGNLFIADKYNHRVRRINPEGVITTVAGIGEHGFSGDNGSASGARLYWPTGVAVDAAGNLFIADMANLRVRRVSPDGVITTVAGTGSQGFSGDDGLAIAAKLRLPTGVAVDADGNLFIADSFNNRIRRVTTHGLITTVAGGGDTWSSGDDGPATTASLMLPSHVAVDAVGNLLITEEEGHRVRRVSPDEVITTIAGNGQPGFDGDGQPAATAQLNTPTAVAIDAEGTVYVADSGNSRIRRFDLKGQ